MAIGSIMFPCPGGTGEWKDASMHDESASPPSGPARLRQRRAALQRIASACGAVVWPAATGLLAAAPAQAQTAAPGAWPRKAIQVVSPFTAGSGTDIVARLIAERLAVELGVPVVVEPRPGAAGNIGAGHAAQQAPDGHTLMVTSASFAIAPALYRNLNFDPIKHFTPVTKIATAPLLVLVPAESPLKTMADLVAMARKDPQAVSYGSFGNGSPSHLMGESIASLAGISITFISMRPAAQMWEAAWIGLPVLWLAVRGLGQPLRIARRDWPELGKLTITNMVVWHVLAILSVQALSSGRAAILGYTMPVFSALWGMALFGQRLAARQLAGVAAAAIGVALLLWHELGRMSGKPWAAGGMLLSAAVWALGTQQLRRARMEAPTLAIVFWMTTLTTLVMTALAAALEHERWHAPAPGVWAAIVFNAVLIFGFAQPVWLYLARALPPVASTLSVMLIPVLGTVSGAWWLDERLHWQDGAAIVLMLLAIASVLWPARAAR